MKKNGVTLLIPSLNEETTIQKVISDAKKFGLNVEIPVEILVADNGSTDRTISIVKENKNISLEYVSILGYGSALHHGILSAKYSYIIFADADRSYDFAEAIKFYPYIKFNYDLVLGSRLKGRIDKGAMPKLNRYIGTPVLSSLISHIYGVKISDCNSGMRLIKKEFYESLHMKNSGMEWASELVIKTILKRGKLAEIPISFHKDERDKKPHLKRWEDGWRHLKVILLLKPKLLLTIAGGLLISALFFLPSSLFTSVTLFLFSEFWILSYLLVVKLGSVINKELNAKTFFLDKLPLVLIGVLVTLLGFIQLFVISDSHIFTKYILFSQMILFDLWLFFIETIKTHLMYPLPDKIEI